MSGTNAIAVKRALIERLQTESTLVGVQVSYAWRRDFGREVIYGGRARIDHDFAAMRGGGRVARDEQVTLTLVIQVRNLQSDPIAGDERVAELLTVVEELLAGDPTLAGLTNLLFAGVKAADFPEPEFDDDGVTCGAAVEIGYRSHLR